MDPEETEAWNNYDGVVQQQSNLPIEHIDKTAADSNKNLALDPKSDLTPRLTDQLTVDQNASFTLT
jgi:hypothetical protein